MRTPLALIAILALLPACASSVTADAKSDPSVEFATFKTFAWLPAEEERAPDAFADNPAADRMLRRMIERHLVAEGLTPADGEPDLYVTYITGVKDILGETVWGRGYGGAGGTGMQTHNRRDATIIVDLIRARDRHLVWRGWAKATIDQFAKSEPIAVDALKKMFALYPNP